MPIEWKDCSTLKLVAAVGDDLVAIIQQKTPTMFHWEIKTASGTVVVSGGATSVEAAKRVLGRALDEHIRKSATNETPE